MIEALAELGKYSVRQEYDTDEIRLKTLTDDPASTERYKHILLIKFDAANNYKYAGIELEEYSKDKLSKYLYKRGSSNGPDITPTARVAGKIEKTFCNKIVNWFKQALDDELVRKDQETYLFLKRLSEELEHNHKRILTDLKEKFDSIDKKERAIISIVIESDPTEAYVGDFQIFRTIVLKKGVEAYYKKYDTESISFEQVCSVCNASNPKVYGFVSTFAFYNVDKPGFVSGGFDQSAAWKNYPVCEQCALVLEEGKKFLEGNFNFRMYNFSYYIIPKPLFEKDSEAVIEKFKYYKNERLSLEAKYKNLIDAKESDIFGYLSEQHNFFNNNLLFYEKSNAAFRILLYVEDVLPSHIRKIFQAKEKVDEKPYFKNFGKEKKDLKFNFQAIYHFFPGSQLRKHFLEIVNSIFTAKKVDYSFLIKWIVDKLRDDYVKDNPTKYSTLRGLQLLLFLHQMNLLKRHNGGEQLKLREKTILDNVETNPTVDAANTLFKEFNDFFDTDAKRAIFLEGVLTQLLLNVQYMERGGATPFKSKLNSLKLDERLLRKLLPDIQNKFQEYEKEYYRKLEKLLAVYMLKAGTRWNMTPDEISFYFVMGMNLSDYVNVKGSSASTAGG